MLIVCIVQIINYCSQAWSPSTLNIIKFERVQIIATKWILNSDLDYTKRLLELN